MQDLTKPRVLTLQALTVRADYVAAVTWRNDRAVVHLTRGSEQYLECSEAEITAFVTEWRQWADSLAAEVGT